MIFLLVMFLVLNRIILNMAKLQVKTLNMTGAGIDCAHIYDITMHSINKNYVDEEATFKMPNFVHIECKKMIDSIEF